MFRVFCKIIIFTRKNVGYSGLQDNVTDPWRALHTNLQHKQTSSLSDQVGPWHLLLKLCWSLKSLLDKRIVGAKLGNGHTVVIQIYQIMSHILAPLHLIFRHKSIRNKFWLINQKFGNYFPSNAQLSSTQSFLLNICRKYWQ